MERTKKGGLRKVGDYVEVGYDSDDDYNQCVRDGGQAGWSDRWLTDTRWWAVESWGHFLPAYYSVGAVRSCIFTLQAVGHCVLSILSMFSTTGSVSSPLLTFITVTNLLSS